MLVDLAFIVLDDVDRRRENTADIVNRMALILTIFKEETIAFQCYFSLLLYRRHENGDNNMRLSDLLYNLENLYAERKDIINAIKCHKECYRITSSARVKSDQYIDNILTLSELALDMSEYTYSNALCDVGLSVAKSQGKRGSLSKFLYLKVRP